MSFQASFPRPFIDNILIPLGKENNYAPNDSVFLYFRDVKNNKIQGTYTVNFGEVIKNNLQEIFIREKKTYVKNNSEIEEDYIFLEPVLEEYRKKKFTDSPRELIKERIAKNKKRKREIQKKIKEYERFIASYDKKLAKLKGIERRRFRQRKYYRDGAIKKKREQLAENARLDALIKYQISRISKARYYFKPDPKSLKNEVLSIRVDLIAQA